jgi:hypothetical protein
MASLSLPPFAPDSFTISGPAWTNLTATWVTVLVITLRYCQASTNVERQYKYLHTLEDKISAELKDDELYRREGRAYRSEYSPFRWWIRRFYVIVLPVVAIIATGVLIYNEWAKLNYPLLGNIFDLELAPIGCGCETGTDAPSSGEFFKLPDEGGCPCPRSHHTSSSPSGNSLKPCFPRERWTTR